MGSRRNRNPRKQRLYSAAYRLRTAYGSDKLTEEQITRLEAIGFEWEPRCSDSLAETHPELAKQWHPTKNGDLTSQDVTAGSRKKVWWKCPDCGGGWQATIGDRANGHGCPYCYGRKALPGFNDLATKRPDIAAEWHPTKNGSLTPRDVTAGSNTKVWWKCPDCGGGWQGKVYHRTRKNEPVMCPVCGSRKTRPVVCIEKGLMYRSIKEAAQSVGHGDRNRISKHLSGKRANAYGYHWRYATEEEIAAHKAGEDSDGQGEE